MEKQLLEALDANRLRRDIEENAEFGRVDTESGRGRTVLPGSEANRTARERLVTQLKDANLEVSVDPVGTIVGRYVPTGVDPDSAGVAAGSHLDSVPCGGIFDGPLGVYGALEAVRAIDDANIELHRPIEIVSFTGEEGHRFTDGLLGSSVASGDLAIEDALTFTDDDGITLRSALEEIGFCGTETIDANAWDAWLELHIEQGERLTETGVPVGIVDSIAGTTRCTVEIQGEANHSGTTWMDDRTDALVAASELVQVVERTARERAAEDGGRTVATVGELETEPGAVNVVPGYVRLRIDIRSTEYDTINAIVTTITAELDRLESTRGVETTFDRPYDIEPVPMSRQCIQALEAAADWASIETLAVHSGAGHDTMQIAKSTNAGLLFVPSQDGISHSPEEWTTWDDCAAGVQLLTMALIELAQE